MPGLETIREIMAKIRIELSNLSKTHRSGLKDTSEFPNYNIVASQIIKIKMLVMDDDVEINEIASIIPNPQKGSLAELKNELEKMADPEKLKQATDAYESIITKFTELQKELSQFLQADKDSAPKASSM